MQTFTLEDVVNHKMVIPCNRCYVLYVVDSAEFSEANDFQRGFHCPACDAKFVVKIVPPDPRRLTLDEADGELADSPATDVRTEDDDESAGQTCPRCGGMGEVMQYGAQVGCPACEGTGQV